MGNADRPAITLSQQISIENAQNDLDQVFWQSLWGFQILLPHAQREYAQRHSTPDNPPPAKEPAKFRWVVGEYARNLFNVEAKVYPDGSALEKWLENLGERILDRVTKKLDEIEERGQQHSRSFEHHGVDPNEIISTLNGAIDAAINLRLGRPLPASLPAPPPSTALGLTPKSVPAVVSGVTTDSLIEQRRKLLAEYVAATGASYKKIYEAQNSKIHKPEFIKWRDGRLPASSVTARNFEAFLKAKKRPVPRNPTS